MMVITRIGLRFHPAVDHHGDRINSFTEYPVSILWVKLCQMTLAFMAL